MIYRWQNKVQILKDIKMFKQIDIIVFSFYVMDVKLSFCIMQPHHNTSLNDNYLCET